MQSRGGLFLPPPSKPSSPEASSPRSFSADAAFGGALVNESEGEEEADPSKNPRSPTLFGGTLGKEAAAAGGQVRQTSDEGGVKSKVTKKQILLEGRADFLKQHLTRTPHSGRQLACRKWSATCPPSARQAGGGELLIQEPSLPPKEGASAELDAPEGGVSLTCPRN